MQETGKMILNLVITFNNKTIFNSIVDLDMLPKEHWLNYFIQKFSLIKGDKVKYMGRDFGINEKFLDLDKYITEKAGEVYLELNLY